MRCKKAGIPEKLTFRTKPEMALDMLKSSYKSDIPFSWVTADSVCGDYRSIGNWLESIKKSYVLAVSGKSYIWQGAKQHRISEIIKTLPEDGWQRLSYGIGTKGERNYDWYCEELNTHL